jgi:hypothetical protein
LAKRKVLQKSRYNFSKIITITIIVVVIGSVSYYFLNSPQPVNFDEIVFGIPENHYLKSIKKQDGSYAFAIQSMKGGKIAPGINNQLPKISAQKGALVSVHFINEEKSTKGVKSMHNFNIDEFNVHTKNLGYFETDSITFQANKVGTFEFYCSLHPEMKGIITIKDNN